MSRIRTGHKPDDWKPEEPRSAHTVSRSGSLAVGISAAERDRLNAKARKEADAAALQEALERVAIPTRSIAKC